jgi:predicted nucleic acid-binding Zn ribbon protein
MTWRPSDHRAPPPPRPVSESLDGVTQSLGGPAGATLASLFGDWETLVGTQIAAHTQPLSLVRGVLSISVDEPGWATQLTYLESELLARIAAGLGDDQVSRIQVRVRPG